MFQKFQRSLLTRISSPVLALRNDSNLFQSIYPARKLSSSYTSLQYFTRRSFSNTYSNYIIDNRFLDKMEKEKNTEIYLINLNRPFDLKVLKSLHDICAYSVMADGAANRFHDKIEQITSNPEDGFLPNALVGDFDSVRPDVIEYYKNKGVTIFHDHSQNDTDLEKCIRFLEEKLQFQGVFTSEKAFKIIITGGFGGRVDHMLNNIHVLHRYAERYTQHRNISLQLMDNNSIGTCILPGTTQYRRARNFEKGAGCGIFPLMGINVSVHTKGLKWDLKPGAPRLSFKDFVSSSNEMVSDTIEITTDQMVFFVTTNTIHGAMSGH